MILNKISITKPIIIGVNNNSCSSCSAKKDSFVKSTDVTFGKKINNQEFNQILTDIREKNRNIQNGEVKSTINSLLNCAIELNKKPKAHIEYNWLPKMYKDHYIDNNIARNSKQNELKKFVLISDNLCSGLRTHINDFNPFEKDINRLTANLKQNHFDNKLNKKTREVVQKTYDEFGVKIFALNKDKNLNIIYDELKKVNDSAKKTGEQLQLPKNIDLITADCKAHALLKTVAINADYLETNDFKEVFRHELTHCITNKVSDDESKWKEIALPFREFLDPEEATELWNKYDGEAIMYNCTDLEQSIISCERADSDLINSAEKKLKTLKQVITNNLKNADYTKDRIGKSFQKDDELLAVAYERLKPNTYDDEFKNILTKLGMPKALLECPY